MSVLVIGGMAVVLGAVGPVVEFMVGFGGR